jgi:hypothetical protein
MTRDKAADKRLSEDITTLSREGEKDLLNRSFAWRYRELKKQQNEKTFNQNCYHFNGFFSINSPFFGARLLGLRK